MRPRTEQAKVLEALLWDCFEGPNKCEADGLAAAIRSLPGGSVALAFCLDGPAFRTASGLANGMCCDRLLLVVQKPPEKEPRLTLLLLEMKGRDHDHALEQLAATLNALRNFLRERLRTLSFNRTRFVAVVISDRAHLADSRTAEEKRFRQKHGASLYTLPGRRARHGQPAPSVDLTDLLRPVTE